MKFIESISILSLITLSNITKAFYVALDDGNEITSASTCLKLINEAIAVTRECGKANEFILENNKLCFKKKPINCLSQFSSSSLNTHFGQETDKHIVITEYNEAGGYLSVENDGTLVKYKYSERDEMFTTGYVQPITFPSTDGYWKNHGLCWTGYARRSALFRSPCRSPKRNEIRDDAIQYWKYEDGYIKSSDGVTCLRAIANRIFTSKCAIAKTRLHFLADREIAMGHRPEMCLVPRMRTGNRTIIALDRCIRQVKFLDSIA